jgi:structural maintenance of chromosomes protein 5
MQAVSRFGPNNEGGGANFVAGSTLNMVQRSRYGKKAPQNMTRDVRPARNLAESASKSNHGFISPAESNLSHAVDTNEKKKIDDRIKEAKIGLSVIEQETAKLEEAMSKSNKETADIKKRYVSAFNGCLIVLTLLLTIVSKDTANDKKKALATAQAKLKSLQHKIGKFQRLTNLM